MNDYPIEQTNRRDVSELLNIVLKNIPAARRVAEIYRVGARRELLQRIAS